MSVKLREYQEEDVQRLMTRSAMGVFNEPRTGKTPTSIVAMQRKGVQRLLVVCPASILYKWKEEYEMWTNNKAYVIDSATLFNKKDTPVPNVCCIIINYENLRDTVRYVGAWEKLLKKYKPDGIIVDEVHRCKDRKSANFKAIKKFNKVETRLYLTGTPAPNKPWDVWAILNFICPTVFTSYWNFIHEYFEEETLWIGGTAINQPAKFKPGRAELLQTNLNYISIMRKRKDVMPWLPKEETPTIIKLPCTPSQLKYIRELEETFETEHVNTQSVLEQLVRIRQICAHPKILNLRGNSPKLDWLKQYIRDYPEKSIIVFSNSKKFIDLVRNEVRCVYITGETNARMRQAFIGSFQKGEHKLIVIQTQAGKEGLTLDRADVTIFLDTYPPAADYMQAKDRMVPTTQENVKPQEIIHLMMKDTYDEHLYKLVKQGISDTEVINDYIKYIKERRAPND